MKFSVITPNFNGERYLEATILSVLEQRKAGVSLEYIVVDGNSTDGSLNILKRYEKEIDMLVREDDTGPANALNKGLKLATGEVISWLNSDDIYYPNTIKRVEECLGENATASFCFGGCPIINEQGEEIRQSITRFKELFFPISSRFVYQSINYMSQPALFFRREIIDNEQSLLREDMIAAWDYELFLRLWHYGKAIFIPGDPLAAFRWYGDSISGQNFSIQFKEELEAAMADAGRWSLQAIFHRGVRLGIVGAYSAMAMMRGSENSDS